MKRCLLITIISVLTAKPLVFATNQRNPILENIGVKRGICALLGDPTCKLALELARESELLIYVQLPQAKNVEKVRKVADDAWPQRGISIIVPGWTSPGWNPALAIRLRSGSSKSIQTIGRATVETTRGHPQPGLPFQGRWYGNGLPNRPRPVCLLHLWSPVESSL